MQPEDSSSSADPQRELRPTRGMTSSSCSSSLRKRKRRRRASESIESLEASESAIHLCNIQQIAANKLARADINLLAASSPRSDSIYDATLPQDRLRLASVEESEVGREMGRRRKRTSGWPRARSPTLAARVSLLVFALAAHLALAASLSSQISGATAAAKTSGDNLRSLTFDQQEDEGE